MSSLVEFVRTSTQRCAAESTLVSISHDAIAAWVDDFDIESARRSAEGSQADALGSLDPEATATDIERRCALALATVAVNFTSGWHDIIRKRPGQSGAVSMIGRLIDYEAATGAFTPARLSNITTADCSQIFEQELDGGSIEQLLSLLADALNDLGEFGVDHGSFASAVDAAHGSADTFAGTLGERPAWNDIAMHNAKPVAFFKRAQLAPATLARAFEHQGPGRFEDLEQLTIFADNLVPHVLRLDGILKVDEQLVATIDNGDLLPHGSTGEVELRANAVHAAELILAEIAKRGGHLKAADIDFALWSRGAGAAYKARRRHRSRNRFY